MSGGTLEDIQQAVLKRKAVNYTVNARERMVVKQCQMGGDNSETVEGYSPCFLLKTVEV